MSGCNACPQHLNSPGRNCRNVRDCFTIHGRGSHFVDIGEQSMSWHVEWQKYGPHRYIVKYIPVQWSCTCKDFIQNLHSERCCKHIMMCIDTVLPGFGGNRFYSGTVYPNDEYLNQNVTIIHEPTEAIYRQWLSNSFFPSDSPRSTSTI